MSKAYFDNVLIKDMDAAALYFKIKDDGLISEYEEAKKQKKELQGKDKLTESEQELVNTLCGEDGKSGRLKELSEAVHSFKDKEVTFKNSENRYCYAGTVTDSLMSRKFRQVAKDRKDDKAFRKSGDCEYTDLIINISFKSDVMISDGYKTRPNKETGIPEVTKEKRKKKLISKKTLRHMLYRDGVVINGVHYVYFQRSSSKARTGNVLFIDDGYFQEMEKWQNFSIPFRKIVKDKEKRKLNKDRIEVTDIVSSRAYTSLTSSSIIGTLDIDPYSILLIDDMSGEYEMECNVVDVAETLDDKGKTVKELQVDKKPYHVKTDLWDGQSLVDESVFTKGEYYTKEENGDLVSHSYNEKGFMLLRNHFFKTAAFNTKLQAYYRSRGISMAKDRFGNEFESGKVMMVTTKNSVKIFKFADIIVEHCIDKDKKDDLSVLEKPLKEIQKKVDEAENKMISAKRERTKLLKQIETNKNGVPKMEIDLAEEKISETQKQYDELKGKYQAESEKLSKPIKFEKERLVWDWYREKLKIDRELFGVCKYEKPSKFGDRQQLWYQILISLNFSYDDLWELAKTQVTEQNLMRKHVAFFKRNLDMRAKEDMKSSMMLELLNINEDVARTKWYTEYRHSQIGNMVRRLLAGKLQIVNSDFGVLVGNPYEMLRASCGDKIETSIINNFECWNGRYKDGAELFGFRSPHICAGNCALLKNTYCEEWRWFNFTEWITVVNFWEKGAFLAPIWDGCDVDSDCAYIGDNPVILQKVKETVTSGKYLIPINGLEPEPKNEEYENEKLAVVDGQLANDMIGKICNYARDLQAYYWHLYNSDNEESKQKYLSMMYEDICILEVLSNIAIDSAKRSYNIDVAKELERLKNRPYLTEKGVIIEGEAIQFTETRYKKSLSDEKLQEYEELKKRMEEAVKEEDVKAIMKDIDKILKTSNTYLIRPLFTKGLKSAPKRKVKMKFADDGEKEVYQEKQKEYAAEKKELDEKMYRRLNDSMDILADVVKDNTVRAKRTDYIEFTDILNPIPKGKKADYNRIEAIKKVGIDGMKAIRSVWGECHSGQISSDAAWDKANNLEKNILNDMKFSAPDKSRKITSWDINKLIRDVYDEKHTKKDKHGKPVLDENGNVVTEDKRDERLVGCIKEDGDREIGFGATFLQWVYDAFRAEFLAAIRENMGTVSYLVEIPDTYETDDEVYELDGKRYVIRYQEIRKNEKSA